MEKSTDPQTQFLILIWLCTAPALPVEARRQKTEAPETGAAPCGSTPEPEKPQSSSFKVPGASGKFQAPLTRVVQDVRAGKTIKGKLDYKEDRTSRAEEAGDSEVKR